MLAVEVEVLGQLEHLMEMVVLAEEEMAERALVVVGQADLQILAAAAVEAVKMVLVELAVLE
jgi:hypothetical protein